MVAVEVMRSSISESVLQIMMMGFVGGWIKAERDTWVFDLGIWRIEMEKTES